MKKYISIALSFVFCFLLFSCGEETSGESSQDSAKEIDMRGIDFEIEGNEESLDSYTTTNPVVAIYVKDYGVIVAELYPDVAPNTVNNFTSLVKKGFYDDNTIHRMLPGFVIQGGDPDGTGAGGPGYSITGEFTNNGFKNNLLHTAGILSMARSTDYDSAGSQFFIMLGTASWLDGDYAAFGKVIDGYDVCQEIEKIEYYTKKTGKLNENLTIVKMVVDTKGVEYPEPVTIPD